MYIYLVKHVGIIKKAGITSGEIDRPHEEPKCLEQKALAATPVALIILTYLVIHRIKCPRA